MNTHYGLKEGDKIQYPAARNKIKIGRIQSFDEVDNFCSVKWKDGTISDAVCEWCAKVNDKIKGKHEKHA